MTGPPRGDEGFGYDPIFVPEGETRTVAELGDAWKREHSHRARAAAALASPVWRRRRRRRRPSPAAWRPRARQARLYGSFRRVPIHAAMAAERPMDDLRSEALVAAQGLLDSEQALAGALRAIREDSARAAEAYRAVVASLATALAARDGYTGAHSDIVHDLAVAVAGRLGLDRQLTAEVEAVALLHDIGKIGVPDHVLHKRGPLDEEEWQLMREHPVIGERILRPLPGLAGVATAVRHEHERWDGTGYPDGRAADEIPLASRIVLACDTYSALVSDRPYRDRARRGRGEGGAPPPRRDAVRPGCRPRAARERRRQRQRPRWAREAGAEASALVAAPAAGEARRLEREVHALITIVSAVATVESLESLVALAAEEACAAVGATSVSISRWEADARVLRVLVNAGELARDGGAPACRRGVPARDGRRASPPAPRGAVLRHQPRRSRRARSRARRCSGRSGRHSSAAVPIMLGGQAWGELWASRDASLPVFSQLDLRFLQTIAGQVAAAVGRTSSSRRWPISPSATRSPVSATGARWMSASSSRCARAWTPAATLAVLMCDADNLKELNDAEGHEAGDAALRRLAEQLAAACPSGRAARLPPRRRRVLPAPAGRVCRRGGRAGRAGAGRAGRAAAGLAHGVVRRRHARRRPVASRRPASRCGRRTVRGEARRAQPRVPGRSAPRRGLAPAAGRRRRAAPAPPSRASPGRRRLRAAGGRGAALDGPLARPPSRIGSRMSSPG